MKVIHLHENTSSPLAVCGVKGHDALMSWEPKEVTCKRCLKTRAA